MRERVLFFGGGGSWARETANPECPFEEIASANIIFHAVLLHSNVKAILFKLILLRKTVKNSIAQLRTYQTYFFKYQCLFVIFITQFDLYFFLKYQPHHLRPSIVSAHHYTYDVMLEIRLISTQCEHIEWSFSVFSNYKLSYNVDFTYWK